MIQDIMLYMSAIFLGAFHAFEPGHGKTVIAAYMIGSRGRAWDGVLLGLIVTFTHTFSVIALGIAAKVLSKSYTEAELHTWLGLVSSMLILSVGLWMFITRLSNPDSHGHLHLFGQTHHDHHSHNSDHDHSHHAHEHHGGDHHHEHLHDHHEPGSTSKWSLLFLGVSGGLVPCPAGIATLLAAIGAGKIAKGLTMALFFSLGLGLVMMAIGVTLSQAGRLTERISENKIFAQRIGLVSSVVIIALGGYTLFHSLQGIR